MTLIWYYFTTWVWLIGQGNLLSPELLGMRFRQVAMTTIFLFCNLVFVIGFRLIVCFLLDQWPMSTGRKIIIKWNFEDKQTKCAADKNDQAVLITGIEKWNPFPISLSNKCRLRMLYSTGMLVSHSWWETPKLW